MTFVFPLLISSRGGSAYTLLQLIFQFTVRVFSGTEIADDPAIVVRLKYLYDEVDAGNTPAAIFLPWWPGRGMIRKLLATKKIYDIITKAVDTRMKSGRPRDDTLQMLLDTGDDDMIVVGFIMGFVIAGARSTGTTGTQLVRGAISPLDAPSSELVVKLPRCAPQVEGKGPSRD